LRVYGQSVFSRIRQIMSAGAMPLAATNDLCGGAKVNLQGLVGLLPSYTVLN